MRYRRVSSGFWLDGKVRNCPEDARWFFLRLLTDPGMTCVGAMRATLPGLAAELGWKPQRVDRAIAPLVQAGMVELNAAAAYIGLPNFLKHNPPESTNVTAAWAKALRNDVPDCAEKVALIERCRDYLKGREASKELKPTFREAFEQVLAGGSARVSSVDSQQDYAPSNGIQEQETGDRTPDSGHRTPECSPQPLSRNSGKPSTKPSRAGVNAEWGRRT